MLSVVKSKTLEGGTINGTFKGMILPPGYAAGKRKKLKRGALFIHALDILCWSKACEFFKNKVESLIVEMEQQAITLVEIIHQKGK